jgi:uncharacterized protein (DUF305 family)
LLTVATIFEKDRIAMNPVTKQLLSLSAAAVAATIALSGCGTTTNSSTDSSAATESATGSGMQGMNHGPSTATAASTPAAATEHNEADTMFARMMIPHHTQAVAMSESLLKKQDIDPRVSALATEIKDAQGPEIETMTGWLSGWGEPTTAPMDHTMEGMMTEADMNALDAAEGADAAKLFLTHMIEHHKGAVTMARDEVANGANPDTIALAQTIISSQETEITTMNGLLGSL